MGKLHNKKRNVGIIYEQIIKYICQKTLEGDNSKVKEAANIIKKYFVQGTQLHKEHKLFKALIETRGISESLGTSILNESKKACNYLFDPEILEIEKSNLIKELNYSFGKGEIFKNQIENYKLYATVQTLLNEWRKSDPDISLTSRYQKKLHKHLITEEIVEDSKEDFKEFDPLVYRLMEKKFNEKYTNILNEEQKEILSAYMSEDKNLSNYLGSLKESSLVNLKNYKQICDNSILLESFDNVDKNISRLDINDHTEENIKKFLSLCKLKEEIKDSSNE